MNFDLDLLNWVRIRKRCPDAEFIVDSDAFAVVWGKNKRGFGVSMRIESGPYLWSRRVRRSMLLIGMVNHLWKRS